MCAGRNDEIDYTHTRAPGVNRTTGLPATGPGISGAPAGGTIASGGNGTNTHRRQFAERQFLWQARADLQPAEKLMIYGSYTRGYKGPAFNVFFNHTAPINAVPIDEEMSDSYEIGLKSRFAE